MVNQREVGQDTNSFARALKSVLREDPDVIIVGELRDLETISLALTAAETGHLVFATVHTNSCVSTLHRIIDVFPPHQQLQVRSQIAMSLMAVLSQTLLSATNGGRVLALEIMMPNRAIRTLIREDKVHQIYAAMQSGQESSGMQTMNQSLLNLVERRLIRPEIAMEKSGEPEELQDLFVKRGIGSKPNNVSARSGGPLGNKRGA